MTMSGAGDVILYDGECGMCDRAVAFILPRDRQQIFRFAALQGPWAQALLRRLRRPTAAFDTMLVATAEDRVLERSAAIFYVLRRLGGVWGLVALFRFLPRVLTDWVYDQIAKRRLRFFGRLATCRIPSASERTRFVDEIA
jgi:predicted DCC family thiol-disulfide oxidoreductase YuxK